MHFKSGVFVAQRCVCVPTRTMNSQILCAVEGLYNIFKPPAQPHHRTFKIENVINQMFLFHLICVCVCRYYSHENKENVYLSSSRLTLGWVVQFHHHIIYGNRLPQKIKTYNIRAYTHIYMAKEAYTKNCAGWY